MPFTSNTHLSNGFIRSIFGLVVIVGAIRFEWQPAVTQSLHLRSVINGTVVDAGSGQPVVQAAVFIEGTNERDRVFTNEYGQFSLQGPPQGQVFLMASKSGYAKSRFGARSAKGSGQPMDLTAGRVISNLTLRLWRHGTVSGTVLDEHGEPIIRARVIAARLVAFGGRPRLELERWARTDDRGAYRITDLESATYAVALESLSAQHDPNLRYPLMFYPQAQSSEGATHLFISSGQDVAGVDFHAALQTSYTVVGTVSGYPPGSARPVKVTLRPYLEQSDVLPTNFDAQTTTLDTRGQFVFAGVFPGRYRISVTGVFGSAPVDDGHTVRMGNLSVMTPLDDLITAFQGTARNLALLQGLAPTLVKLPTAATDMRWGELAIDVEKGNLAGLEIALQHGAALSGRVEFDGTAGRPSGDVLRSTPVLALSITGRELASPSLSGIGDDGTFRTVGLLPGQYQLLVPVRFGGWVLESVKVNGRYVPHGIVQVGTDDLTDVVLAFTNRVAELRGVVLDRNGGKAPDATVYVFPRDRSLWFQAVPWSDAARELRPISDGVYRTTVLPGDYYVVALADSAGENWRLTSVLDSLAKVASTVRVVSGQQVARDLTVSDLPRR